MERTRILIVEDETVIVLGLESKLGSLVYQVTSQNKCLKRLRVC